MFCTFNRDVKIIKLKTNTTHGSFNVHVKLIGMLLIFNTNPFEAFNQLTRLLNIKANVVLISFK